MRGRPLALLAAVAVGLAACTGGEVPRGGRGDATTGTADGGDAKRGVSADVERVLAAMPLRDRLAQLLVVHVYGGGPDETDPRLREANLRLYGAPTPRAVVESLRPGGVVFVRRNSQDPEAAGLETRNLESLGQIEGLTKGLQCRAGRTGAGVGLLIATDEEGGEITRLPPPSRPPPAAADLGAGGDARRARRVAAATGRSLAEVGVNLNLAPVADVNTNPDNPVIGDRSFGSDPGVVARMVRAQVAGYHRAGIAATAKHFPGHGHAASDSHTSLPVIDLASGVWERVHLRPFAAAVDAGVDAVMTAHLAAPALDGSGLPATLSRPILTGLLRERLGFDGLIVTDSLWMAGVRRGRDDVDVAVAALRAGADVLLMPPFAADLLDGLTRATRRGRLDAKRVDASVRRVLRLKGRLGLLPGGRSLCRR